MFMDIVNCVDSDFDFDDDDDDDDGERELRRVLRGSRLILRFIKVYVCVCEFVEDARNGSVSSSLKLCFYVFQLFFLFLPPTLLRHFTSSFFNLFLKLKIK